MTKEQAVALIRQVCEQYRGTLVEHQALQRAVEAINKLVEPVVEPVVEEAK